MSKRLSENYSSYKKIIIRYHFLSGIENALFRVNLKNHLKKRIWTIAWAEGFLARLKTFSFKLGNHKYAKKSRNFDLAWFQLENWNALAQLDLARNLFFSLENFSSNPSLKPLQNKKGQKIWGTREKSSPFIRKKTAFGPSYFEAALVLSTPHTSRIRWASSSEWGPGKEVH